MLTQVLEGLSDAGSVDVTGTSAIGPLGRLRTQCRAAKERLSTTSATSLVAELPGHRGEVRLTRNELDEAIRQPLDDFAGVVQETLDRNGARGLAAVATAGGGARVPLITTTLSEHFGVPVITTPQPELTAAIGGGLQAARGTDDLGATAMAEAVAPPTAAAAAVAATQMAPEVLPDDMGSGGSSGLAWSEADDVPDVVAPTDPYDYGGTATTDAMGGPRPQMQFEPETEPVRARQADDAVRPAGRGPGPGTSRDRVGGVVRVAQQREHSVAVVDDREHDRSLCAADVGGAATACIAGSAAAAGSSRPSRRRSRALLRPSRRRRRRHRRRARPRRRRRRRARPRRQPRSRRRRRPRRRG